MHPFFIDTPASLSPFTTAQARTATHDITAFTVPTTASSTYSFSDANTSLSSISSSRPPGIITQTAARTAVRMLPSSATLSGVSTASTGSSTSTASRLRCPTCSFPPSRTLSMMVTPSYLIVVITVTPLPVPNPDPLSSGGLDSPSSSTLSTNDIANSLIVVISVLSTLAGLSIFVGILLCFRVYKHRRRAQRNSIDPERDAQRSPSILVIGPSPEMLQHQQQSRLEKELPLPPVPSSPQTLDLVEDDPTSPSTLSAAHDWENVSNISQREKRGTIASSELQHGQSTLDLHGP